MKRAFGLFLVLAGLAFAGPGQAAVPGDPLPQSDPIVPQSVWRRSDDASGLHQQSALACPVATGAFRLTELLVNDDFGLDVACGYDHPAGDGITLFFSKNTTDYSFALHLQDSLFAPFFSNTPTQTSRVPLPQFDTLRGKWLGSLYDHQPTTQRSGLWLADYHGWTLKLRATYEIEREIEMLNALSELTAIVDRTAGPHLRICETAAAPERTGMLITDRMRIRELATAAGTEMAAETRTPPAATWCAEAPLDDRGAALLLWRDASGDHDRIMLMTIDAPLILESASQGAPEQPGAPAIYRLQVPFEGKMLLFGFFEGRPSVAALLPLVRGVIVGIADPVAVFDPATGRVTLPR